MADENDVNIGINVNSTGAESGARRSKAAIKGVTEEGIALGAAMRRLRQSIDPTFAAQEKYNRSLNEAKALLDANLIKKKEYNAAVAAAKTALDQEVAAIQRRSAAGRAAAEEEKRLRREEAAAARQSAAAQAAAAREAAQAKRLAERGAREEAKTALAAERAAVRQAAQEAKQAAREKEQAERQAAAEVRRAQSEARAAEKAAIREAARVAREEARATAASEKAASQESLRAERDAKRQAAEAARNAAAVAAQAKRDQVAAERQAARELAALEAQARREQVAAARAAANAAKEAAREKANAEREAAKATREAAKATEDAARAAKQEANAVAELRSSIDPAFAAQSRYNETMRRATQLLMANKLQQGEWIAIQKQAKAQMDVNVRSMGRMNAVSVQMGYQAQDVAASIASGINPAVIFAQQMGQTAAAASQMGGKIGAVAAFLAGPWGAAITIAVLGLGYLWDSLSEGEEKTKDLMRAEDRRRMTVKELTEAIREYTRAQEEANNTTLQGASNQAYATAEARNKIFTEMAQAQDRLRRAQDALNLAMQNPDGAEAMLGLQANVWLAQRAVDSLKKSYDDAVTAAGEARAAYVQTTSDMTENEIREMMEQQAALGAFRREWKAAGTDVQKQAAVTSRYQNELSRIQEHYNKLKEEEAEARRRNAAAAREEERALFTSRQDAIGTAGKELRKAGYNVGENVQFGGVRGNHPGMGNKAHGQYAIDINVPGYSGGKLESQDPVIRKRMDDMVKAYQARGFRVLWNGKVYEPFGQGASYDIKPGANQHRDHAHMEAPQSIVGQSAGKGLGQQMVNDMETAAQAAARAAIEAIDTMERALEYDLSLGAAEKLAIVQKMEQDRLKLVREAYGEQSKQYEDAKQHELEITQRYNQQILQNEQQRLRYEQTVAEIREAMRDTTEKAGIDDQAGAASFLSQNGLVGEQQSFMMKGQILDAEYQQQMQHEERMYQIKLQYLQMELNLPNQSAERRNEINQQIQTAEQQHLAQMLQLNSQYTNNVKALQRDAAQAQMDKWKQVATTLTSSMGSAFQGLWTRSMTFHQAFIQMADQMVYKVVDMGLKMLENWIMSQIQMTAVQQAQDVLRVGSTAVTETAKTGAVLAGQTAQTGARVAAGATEQTINTVSAGSKVAAEAIKTGAAVTGAATQTGVAATAGMTEIGTNAAVAAAGAYKSTVVIPFIGPIAAPAAAALALAAVLGFGALISSRGGMGEVGADGQMAVLHAKETVLPAWIAEPMRQMFVNPRRSAGSGISGVSAAASDVRNSTMNQGDNAVFNYAPRHTNMGATFDTLLKEDARSLRRWIKNEIRNGGLKLRG